MTARRAAALLAVTLAALTAPGPAPATDGALPGRLARALAVPHVQAAQSSALVIDLATGEPVFAQNEHATLAPASNEKLAVTYAALTDFGTSFRFQTVVLGEGGQDGPVWDGNLVLQGHGDPTLSSAGLAALAAQLREAGIRHVTGSIVGDETFFDARRLVAGWKPSFSIDESPPLSALSVDRGRYHGVVGREPAQAAAALFQEVLHRRGIVVDGPPETRRATANAFPLASISSDPLEQIVRFMDRESDNFTAELLLKELGAVMSGKGTSAAGAAEVTRVLGDAGVPLGGVRIVDGSGLSRADRLTAAALVEILRLAWSDPDLQEVFTAALPVAGVNGTLDHRLRRGPARGAVRAKTGTTAIASALSGYVRDRFAFAILQNGHPLSLWWARHAQDRVAQLLAAQ
jgi:D-alanyl-D-alanine carboxypeptidase/D-alanyl-D-alanine-endopeptidase (penicillin-binding protein 4)